MAIISPVATSPDIELVTSHEMHDAKRQGALVILGQKHDRVQELHSTR